MSIIGKFGRSKVVDSAKEVIGIISKTIDDTTSSDEEKLSLKNKLGDIVLDKLINAFEIQSEIIKAEAKGSWLQRNWRPLVMFEFAQVIVYNKVVGPLFDLKVVELEHDFWVLLELGLGGYVAYRSAEKIAKTLTKKVDLSFIKKKNRKLE